MRWRPFRQLTLDAVTADSRSDEPDGCRLMRMLRFRPGLVIAATCLCLAPFTGCAKTGSHRTTCSTREVSPGGQPGGATPRAALDNFIKGNASGLPKSGYTLESHNRTRYIFASGLYRVSVSKLPTTKGEPAVWVVMLTFDCT